MGRYTKGVFLRRSARSTQPDTTYQIACGDTTRRHPLYLIVSEDEVAGLHLGELSGQVHLEIGDLLFCQIHRLTYACSIHSCGTSGRRQLSGGLRC